MRHYEAACKAFRAGELNHALAEVDLVLTPSVHVFVDAPSSSQQYRASMDGMKVWSRALDDDCPFVLVEKRSDADVVITFAPKVTDEGESLCGHVEWSRRAVYSSDRHSAYLTGKVTVATLEQSGTKHDASSLVHIVAHELGHILGLCDTDQPSDIMGPDLHGNASTALAPMELTAIHQLRAQCKALHDEVVAKQR